MADNVDTKTATNIPVATDVVTYSGDANQNVQLVRFVGVTGAEGSKTVQDLAVSTAFADGESNTQNVLATEAYLSMYNGSTWDRVRGDTTSGLWVNIKTDVNFLADDAAFTPATSKVLPTGYTLDDTSTDLVDEGDIGAARMTGDRRQIIQLGESGAKDVVGGGSKTDGTDQSIMAGVASTYNYLCWLTVYNSSSTNTYATLKDGSTTRAIIPLPAYGGAVLQWPRGLRSTANTAWNVAAGTSVTTAYFYGGGYTATA